MFYPINANLSSNIEPMIGKGFLTPFAALIIPIIIKIKEANPKIPIKGILTAYIIMFKSIPQINEKITNPKACFK